MSETYSLHVRACLGIYALVTIFKFPMKIQLFGPIETKLLNFIGVFLKTGGGGGVHGGGRMNPLNPNKIRHCLYMYANALAIWLHHT